MRRRCLQVVGAAILFVAAMLLGAALPALGQVTTEHPASMIVFPKVVFDGSRDTVIQVTNNSNGGAYALCWYVNGARPFPSLLAEEIRTVAGGSVPPAAAAANVHGDETFSVVDRRSNDDPLRRRVGRPRRGQVQRRCHRGCGWGGGADGRLILGEPSAEYEGCPETVMLNHFFDHVLDPVAEARQIFTTLTLTPCTANFYGTHPPLTGLLAQLFVSNEFEQTFSTSRQFTMSPSLQLSLIDTSNPMFSIFSAAVQGTLTGTTRIRNGTGGPGFVGIAVERHESLADSARVSTVAFNLHSEGERAAPDVLELGPCSTLPSSCRVAASNSLVLWDHSDDRREDTGLCVRSTFDAGDVQQNEPGTFEAHSSL